MQSKFYLVLGIATRVVLLTFVFTLLAFAVGLFCGIGASVLYGFIKHVHPDMSWAYKFVAAPLAAIALVVTFFAMLINEVRRARRSLQFSRPATRTF